MDPKTQVGADLHAEMPVLCTLAIDMLRETKRAFIGQQLDSLDAAERLGRLLHERKNSLAQRLVHRFAGRSILLDADQHRLFVPMHLERVGEHVELLMHAIRTMVREGTPFTDRAHREVVGLVDGAIDLLVHTRDLLLTGNEVLRRHVIDAGRMLVARADDCAAYHQQRLIEGVCVTRASSIYLAMLDALKGVEWQAREVAQKLDHLTPADLRDVALALEASIAAGVFEAPAAPQGTQESTDRPRPSPVGWVP